MTSEPPRLLLIGFEPFGGDAINPATEILHGLDGMEIGGHRVLTAILPVTFDGCGRVLEAALDASNPAIVLGIGLAGGRPRLSLERVAINLVDARIADNAGAQPVDVPVIDGAPGAYFTTLPVKLMLRAMLDAGVPAELSLTAGSFVCNAMFFAARHWCEAKSRGTRAGFLHLPWLPEQARRHGSEATIDLPTQRRGLLAALAAAATHRTDTHEALGTLC